MKINTLSKIIFNRLQVTLMLLVPLVIGAYFSASYLTNTAESASSVSSTYLTRPSNYFYVYLNAGENLDVQFTKEDKHSVTSTYGLDDFEVTISGPQASQIVLVQFLIAPQLVPRVIYLI